MWKVSNSYVTEEDMNILLVDVEDEEHWTRVDKITYQVLEDMGLIFPLNK